MPVRAEFAPKVVTWKLDSEQERTRYLASRRGRAEWGWPSVLTLSLGVVFTMLLRGRDPNWFFVGIGIVSLYHTVGWLVRSMRPLRSVVLVLHQAGMSVIEIYDARRFGRRTMIDVGARTTAAVTWITAGLLVRFKGVSFFEKPTVVPMEFFKDEKSIDALYAWAEAHGIPVEGVRPLPGAYVRSLEGPRAE